jgi:hypothetical protein
MGDVGDECIQLLMSPLILKRAKFSRPSGQWQDEDYDVLADGKVVGRIYPDANRRAAGVAVGVLDQNESRPRLRRTAPK